MSQTQVTHCGRMGAALCISVQFCCISVVQTDAQEFFGFPTSPLGVSRRRFVAIPQIASVILNDAAFEFDVA